MNRRGAGVVFCLIAALLYSTRFVSAAIWGSGGAGGTWCSELFRAMYNNIGSGLTTASIISMLVGVAYLVWAEIDDVNKK